MITRAFVRGISDSYHQATVETPSPEPIDVENARSQHLEYVRALKSLGLEVIEVPPDSRFPDCCFIEDCALFYDGVALITNPGASSRRGETAAVRTALERFAVRIELTSLPATLDGGDCLRVGSRIYVGISARTNAEGAACVKDTFGPAGPEVVSVPVIGALHLKSVCSYLGDGVMVLAEGTIPHGSFREVDILDVPRSEAYAANCLAVNGSVICSKGYPHTEAKIKASGFEVISLDMSEIKKGDGSLTCLSILF